MGNLGSTLLRDDTKTALRETIFSGMCRRGQSVFLGAKKKISRTSEYEERRGEEVSKKPFFFNKRDIVNL